MLRPPVPQTLSPSTSNPNATWEPKAEKQAVEHKDRIEQEETNEFMLPPSLSPSTSNPNAIWAPKSERQALERQEQDQLTLPDIPTAPGPAPLAILENRRASAFPPFSSDSDLRILPAFVHRKIGTRARAVPILLTIACLSFLLATSLLAFLFLSKRHEPLTRPSLTAVPNSSIDFGSGAPGEISQKTITLINSGGGQITWQASSDQKWLTVTPNKGTFSGSKGVELTVNRGALSPQAYTGHVIFTQEGSTAPSLTLSVTMSVKGTPASLVLSTASLSFNGSTTQNPPDQVITLQNSGGQPLNWKATLATGDGAPWLSMYPSEGRLDGNASTTITVSVQSLGLAVGSYQGTISFQGGANPQVTVTLSVVPPANLTVPPTPLNLLTEQGQKSIGQITLQDAGGLSLDWTASAVTTDGASWLSVSPASGHLDPGVMQNLTVTADAGTLPVNSYQGTLIFTYGTSTKQVAITLLVSLPPTPGISVQSSSLIFNTTQGVNPPAQTFAITNIGNAPLNWGITEDANAKAYLTTSLRSSTTGLPPGKSITITVTPNVSNAGPGSIAALITVFDSDKGSSVPQQQVAVTINIASAAIINAAPSNMTFDQTSTITNSQQFLYLTNTGSAQLNWSLAQGSQPPVPWLSVNTTSGSLAPGAMLVIFVTCDSSQLSPGTYTATLTVSDSDPGSPVLPQTITVTLTVSS